MKRRHDHDTAPSQPSRLQPTPLKPRPRLLLGLAVAYAAWLAFLLLMYFTTVFPRRHP
jgi:ABC-type uncharacterized transport system permease subunit